MFRQMLASSVGRRGARVPVVIELPGIQIWVHDVQRFSVGGVGRRWWRGGGVVVAVVALASWRGGVGVVVAW